MTKKAVLYARVSTDDQADKGYSLPSQLEMCRKYAERLGYDIVAELREDYSGATAIADRPTGKQLAAMVRTRMTDAVIVYQVDRLSRDIVDLLATVRIWIQAGIEVHTCDIGKIESELDIVLVIKGWQGSDERKKIRERTMRGKRAKAEAGKLIACRPPYGYTYLRDQNNKVITLVIDEATAQVVRLIYQWYVYGDENGKALPGWAIAKRLSEMHVPTPGELRTNRRLYKRKRPSGVWNMYTIIAILSEEAYAGTWHFNETSRATRKVRASEEHILINVPAIIDPGTWKKAQDQKTHNKAMSNRNGKRDYLLRGLITCGCERAMCGQFGRRRGHYICTSYHLHPTERKPHICHVRQEAIEGDLWREIEELFTDLDRLWNDLKKAQADELAQQAPKQAELEAVEVNIQQTESKAAGLVRTMAILAQTDPDGVVAKSMQVEIEQTNALHRAQLKRRGELQAELGTQRLTDSAIAEIMQYARDVRAGIANADFATKRRMLESLYVKVTAKEGRYLIKCVLGKAEGTITKIDKRRKVPIVTSESK